MTVSSCFHVKHSGQRRAIVRAFTMVELLVVIAIISLLLGVIGSAPGLLQTNRRVTALQQVVAVLEEARSQALRGNQAVYVAFATESKEYDLKPYRQYALFLEDEDKNFIRSGPWHTLPDDILFHPSANAVTGAWINVFHPSANSYQEIPLENHKILQLPCIGFGKLGSVIHPSDSSGPIGIVVAEGYRDKGQFHFPNPSSNLSMEIRRNTGKTLMHP